MPRTIATDPRDRQRDGPFGHGLTFEHQLEILAAKRHGALVAARDIVQYFLRRSHVSPGRRLAGRETAVGLIRLILRDGQHEQLGVLRRREQLADVERRRRRISLRDVKGQPVRHHTSGVEHGHGAVLQGGRIEVDARHAVRRQEQMRHDELDGIFEVAAVGLKRLLREMHALVPDHARHRRGGAHATPLLTYGAITGRA